MRTARRFSLAISAVLICLAMAVTDVPAAEGYDQVAGKSQVAKADKILASYGMTPVDGSRIEDGEYIVGTECSSSFFKIEQAKLTVSGGEMTALLTMSSSSYLFVYPGTAEEAAAAPLEDYIPTEKIEGWNTFTVPVEALDTELDLAAYSKRKKKWYPRKILFHAADIPADKLDFIYPDYDRIDEAIELYDETNGTDTREELRRKTEGGSADGAADDAGSGDSGSGGGYTAEGDPIPVAIEESDGTYSIEVDLAGGSGRASVTSPTWLYVRDGKAYARLLWSSTYYDYLILGGKTYLNETTDGGPSSFTIPITAFDEAVPIVGDTTAMGDPLEIDYTLTFYSDTVNDVRRIPQEAAKIVLIIAFVIMVVGGIINFFVKRKRL